MKATYGLASPVEFQIPNHSPLWTPVAFAAIDSPRAAPSDAANSVCTLSIDHVVFSLDHALLSMFLFFRKLQQK